MFYHLTNKSNQKCKNIKKAVWLVCGLDPNGDVLDVGVRDRSKSGPAIRSFSDGCVHEIYGHPMTKVDEHYYTDSVLDGDSYENAGVNKRQFRDIKGDLLPPDWYQVDILDGDVDLSEILPSPDYPDGAYLRKTKHRFFNMLLKGRVLRIWMPHLRDYMQQQQFLDQWALVDAGEPDAAVSIRKTNIRHAKAGRAVRKTLKNGGNGKSNNDNWKQVERQLENPEELDAEPGDEPEEVAAVGGNVLLIADYNNKENAINMYDLPAGNYEMRVGVLPYPWPWDPRNPKLVSDWTKFAGDNYRIDTR